MKSNGTLRKFKRKPGEIIEKCADTTMDSGVSTSTANQKNPAPCFRKFQMWGRVFLFGGWGYSVGERPSWGAQGRGWEQQRPRREAPWKRCRRRRPRCCSHPRPGPTGGLGAGDSQESMLPARLVGIFKTSSITEINGSRSPPAQLLVAPAGSCRAR